MSLFPNLRQLLPAYFFALVVSLVVSMVVGEVLSPRPVLLVAEFTFFLLIAAFVRIQGNAPEHLLLPNAVPGRSLVLCVLVTVCASLLVTELHNVLGELMRAAGVGLPLYRQRLMLEIQVARHLAELWQPLVVVVLVPAVLEELVFRGVVFSSLCFHYGPRVALFGSSLLFAAFHMDPWHFPAVFLLGLFFGALVYLTHSIYAAVLAHLINNLISVVGVNLQAHMGLEALAGTSRWPPALLLAAAVLCAVGVVMLKRQPTTVPLPSPSAYRNRPPTVNA